jgi:uncharacterized protein YcbX
LERIGTLNALRRYPVKSMAGEDLDEVRVTFAGLAGDRVYAFMETDNRTSFPWMTARHGRDWILFRPRFLDPAPAPEENPFKETYAAEVATPEGQQFLVNAPELTQYLEKRFGRPLRLRFSERSMNDAQPVSIFGLGTIGRLSEETGKDLDARRFRANFYVRWDDERPFFEDTLVGRQLRIGETVTVLALEKNIRCVMITFDPDDGTPFPKLLEQVARQHAGCAGIYGTVLREGIVRRHDPVCVV